MAHRDGSGNKIEDIEAARAQWRAAGTSKKTYCSKKDLAALPEDFGDLVLRYEDGEELRQHATVHFTARGGSIGINHNCVITCNPTEYAAWEADPRPVSEKGFVPKLTYYPASELEEMVERCVNRGIIPVTGWQGG